MGSSQGQVAPAGTLKPRVTLTEVPTLARQELGASVGDAAGGDS
jgi:hypothetical protein